MAAKRHGDRQAVKELGKYIVADPKICHGAPTFRGTRILVSIVLEQVAQDVDWDRIVWEWDGKVPREAIAEAVRLAGETLAEHAVEAAGHGARRRAS